jgi:hypothetical protein
MDVMRAHPVLLVGVAMLAACSPADKGRAANSVPPTQASAAPPARADSSPPPATVAGTAEVDELAEVARGAIPGDVAVACDSVAAVAGRAIGLSFDRADGSFADSFRGTPRVGCRLRADGYPALGDTIEATTAIEGALAPYGWAMDLRYMADGPDGSDIGLRHLALLCQVGVYGIPDDDDADTVPATPPDSSVTVTVECARDIADNADAGVPDSLWEVARAAGVDSLYAIDMRLQYPPYLDGDFDGDGVADAAVLVQERATGKLGVAFVVGTPRRVAIVGAGTAIPDVGDDLSWIHDMDHVSYGVTYDLAHRALPRAPFDADALRLTDGAERTLFLGWRGGRFVAERP